MIFGYLSCEWGESGQESDWTVIIMMRDWRRRGGGRICALVNDRCAMGKRGPSDDTAVADGLMTMEMI